MRKRYLAVILAALLASLPAEGLAENRKEAPPAAGTQNSGRRIQPTKNSQNESTAIADEQSGVRRPRPADVGKTVSSAAAGWQNNTYPSHPTEGGGEEPEPAPAVQVELLDEPSGVIENRAYYNRQVRARITVTDAGEFFDGEAANEGIRIRARGWDGDGLYLEPEEMISEWTHEGNIHCAEVTFSEEGHYTWSVSYTNSEGTAAETVSDQPYTFAFTIDRQDPRGAVYVGERRWDRLLTALTFGFYRSSTLAVRAEAEDQAGPVKIFYHMTDRGEPLSAGELDRLEFQEFHPLLIVRDKRFVIYLRIVDAAGNMTYVSSDGYILDVSAPEIDLSPTAESKYGSYNRDVVVSVSVRENASGSGIRRVEYWTEPAGGAPSESALLYEDRREQISPDNLRMDWQGWITVPAKAYNGSCRTLWVRTTDRAGNEKKEKLALDFDIRAPEISVSFGGDTPVRVEGERGYFRDPRTAEVTITERTAHFDPEAASLAVRQGIHAEDAEGNEIPLDLDAMLSSWKTAEGNTPDGAQHSLQVRFLEDGNYTFNFRYQDLTGNESGAIESKDAAPTAFTVDRTAPFGYLRAESPGEWEKTWTKLSRNQPSALRAQKEILISAGGGDFISPLEPIRYLRTDGTEEWDPDRLKALTGWEEFHDLSVTKNDPFAICLKITDYCGNTAWLTSDRMMVEPAAPENPRPPETEDDPREDDPKKPEHHTNPENPEDHAPTHESREPENQNYADRSGDQISPRVSVNYELPASGIFSDDAALKIRAWDPSLRGACSGLSRVWYEIRSLGKLTGSGELFSAGNSAGGADRAEPSSSPAADRKSAEQSDWNGLMQVDSEKNNSNDVRVCVYAADQAGNTTRNTVFLKIDRTAPAVEVAYDNNQAINGRFFSGSRTASITVTERNFRPGDIQVNLDGTGGSLPALSGWRIIPGNGNGDDTRHVAYLTFREDGDYTFSLSCWDAAGNTCAGVEFPEGTMAPRAFTIDTVRPEISVRYDNNRAQNGSYFREGRTAHIEIRERNFDPADVRFLITSAPREKKQTVPAPVWSHKGDLHSADLRFAADGTYTFDLRALDQAGNLSAMTDFGTSAAAKNFTIDTGIDTLEITGAAQGASYRKDAGFEILFADRNYAESSVKLLRTRKGEKDKDVTRQLVKDETPSGSGTQAVRNDKTDAGATQTVWNEKPNSGGTQAVWNDKTDAGATQMVRSEKTDAGATQADQEEKTGGTRRVRAVFGNGQEHDGIYTLTASLRDRAGNQREETIVFTVNRFGSVYVLQNGLRQIMSRYVRRVDEDLVITEYNPDPLIKGSADVQITRNAKPLKRTDYSITPAIRSEAPPGESGWYQYDYVIRSSNFTGDGLYRISVSSKDKAGNRPETANYRDCDVAFYVDSTAPEISNISGLEQPAVNSEHQDVTFEIYDTMGIRQVKLFVNGKETAVEDASPDRSVFSGSVRLKEGVDQKFRLVAEDFAGNITDTDAPDFQPGFSFCRKITVSPSPVKRVYARSRAVIEAGADAIAEIVADTATDVKEDPAPRFGMFLIAAAAAAAIIPLVLRRHRASRHEKTA